MSTYYRIWYRYLTPFSSEAFGSPTAFTCDQWLELPFHKERENLPAVLAYLSVTVQRNKKRVHQACADADFFELEMQLRARYYALTDNNFNPIVFGHLEQLDPESFIQREIVIGT